ncbi:MULTISPECIES: malonate decarboxylase holo-[acyl-carrier-protein] synthase [Pseudoxanthomonas]|uniref:Phosphoribosyl-dephospho-CoA transferase n=1 Tax=Pseudoxanthomonas winnipegensis TaxID=2480810 RepID=A0AAW8G6P7_9GAMM|nr:MULTISPECIES: malonate decarboxylase holo-[acyl-carrier-protein] synthase [Pseudoxanthomonas]MDQ1117815.1 phosphoribosyl-dephospho-CoA transferase [Pseudoxanthomonas winnipegensis]MDQ1134784.1 phosphoribosyl-dephospho-CoA transferase [Pseudoxanthomonas winnipegensis]MDR6138983.1 phosphoribosyl-dephospho-CoA transferase [Pseudoxanthomonas sp. SORGH_AS_0997]
MPEPLRRHTLVWLPPQAAHAVVPAQATRARAWFEQGHPAIVARRPAATPADPLHLGVPLPPAEGKQRLAVRAAVADVLRIAPPPTLEQSIARAPAAWRPALAALVHRAHALDLVPRVFGAFCWQTLTGLAYVHETSDLDLLWEIESAAQADAIIRLLDEWERHQRRRADGELRLPDGRAVSWREYAGSALRLLVKTEDDARLVARADLFAAQQVAA